MTERQPKDLAASVRQRLLNWSQRRQFDFQYVLTRYGIERLLYRLSRSPFSDRFVLKGAMLFVAWEGWSPRPTFPTLLDLPAPTILAYARETVVAEKYHALVTLGLANSRMKDFYDLWALARQFTFEGATLAQAIESTFGRRQTPLPTSAPGARCRRPSRLVSSRQRCPRNTSARR
jgi:nucleotidyltransferase AbiEii toxin of type IV toxin-antitoxin system